MVSLSLPDVVSNAVERRFAAIVLPELLVEIALGAAQPGSVRFDAGKGERGREKRIAVVCTENEESSAKSKLDGVSARARHLGIYAGQTVAEATAMCSELEIRSVRRAEIIEVLTSVAEVACAFGSPVALELEVPRSRTPERKLPDTVWVEVTGAAGLFGGEEALALELQERVRLLGHLVRVVIAGGPKTAQILAHYAPLGEGGVRVVPPSGEKDALAELSVFALGLEPNAEELLIRLGIASVSALGELPPETILPRLGAKAAPLLDLVLGRERTPLRSFEFPAKLSETCEWETPLDGLEPLTFALRGVVGRLAARLGGRGQAAKEMRLVLELETRGGEGKNIELPWLFSAPIARTFEFERILSSRLEKVSFDRRIVSLSLELGGLVERNSEQLDLGRGDQRSELILPVLLEELEAEVGKGRIGLLAVEANHRPEKRSRLRNYWERVQKSLRPLRARGTNRVTRLLREPLALPVNLARGESLALGSRVFSITRVDFVERLEGVEWWTGDATSRDYYWLWLTDNTSAGLASGSGYAGVGGGKETVEALVFRDRRDSRVYLHGVSD